MAPPGSPRRGFSFRACRLDLVGSTRQEGARGWPATNTDVLPCDPPEISQTKRAALGHDPVAVERHAQSPVGASAAVKMGSCSVRNVVPRTVPAEPGNRRRLANHTLGIVTPGGPEKKPRRSGARFRCDKRFHKETVPAGRPHSGSVFSLPRPGGLRASLVTYPTDKPDSTSPSWSGPNKRRPRRDTKWVGPSVWCRYGWMYPINRVRIG